jgi:two-component system sensor histidine kinase SenX3
VDIATLVGIVLAVGLGVVLGAAAVIVVSQRGAVEPQPLVREPDRVDELVHRGVQTLRAALVVVDSSDRVVVANPAASSMGVVRDGRISHGTLRTLARQARGRGGEGIGTGAAGLESIRHTEFSRDIESVRDTELDLPQGGVADPLAVRVRIAPLGPSGHVVLHVADATEVHKVAKVRRDFVANVSHELKTPVGALQLLAEAVYDATDDPEAVRRFAKRMQHESTRLGRLVQELIDLSRLEGADPLQEARTVSVDRVIAEVLDRSRMAAEARMITVVPTGEQGLVVTGSEDQLVTALGNLVDNAIAYSPERTRVAVGVHCRNDLVEFSVTDQGIGIAEVDLDRIFERFYRADPARSRATGGTGLGLAIVKHIATNHGGSVDVWSVEGAGSTFTLRLPSGLGERLPGGAGERLPGGAGERLPGGAGEFLSDTTGERLPGTTGDTAHPVAPRSGPVAGTLAGEFPSSGGST